MSGLENWIPQEPAVQAAWAQAILSAMAIVVAGWLPFSVGRRDRHRIIGAYQALVHAVEAEAEGLASMINHGEGRFLSDKSVLPFARRAAAFSNVAFHDLPDFRLVTLFHDVREACDDISSLAARIIERGKEASPITKRDGELMRSQVSVIVYCSRDIERIRNDYAFLKLRNRATDAREWVRYSRWRIAELVDRILGRED